MSEIFEALRKAQRAADARGQQQSTTASRPPDGASGDKSGRPVSAGQKTPTNPGSLPWWRRLALRGRHNGKHPGGNALAVMRPGHSSPFGEQFRVLRTRLDAAGRGAIMTTSALDQEGKSLCATNLAVTLSRGISGGTILVDADLRHPSVAGAFGISRGPGLVECLHGEANVVECLRETEFDRLKVLPAGRATSMAPELLGSERMHELTARLKVAFPDHHILFDAPPLLLTADPLAMARAMDHILLVIRAGVTPRAAVLKAVEMLGPERFLGAIFNGTSKNLTHYYYYNGRYPYAYGYNGAPYGEP